LFGLFLLLASIFVVFNPVIIEGLDMPFRMGYYVRKIYQIKGEKFTNSDYQVVKKTVPSEIKRKEWLFGKESFEENIFTENDANQEFIRWSSDYVLKNIFHLIKAQQSEFYDSTFLGNPKANYVVDDEEYKHIFMEEYREVDLRNKPTAQLPHRIYECIVAYMSQDVFDNRYSFLMVMLWGTYIPFVFVNLYFIMACSFKSDALIPLTPLFMYCIFMYFFQTTPRAYYWSWLAFSYYFIVFGLGYDIVCNRKIT